MGDSTGRIGLLVKKEVKDINEFFSVNIFIIKQSMKVSADESICGREGLIGGILWYKHLEGLLVLFIKKGYFI